MGRVLQGGDGEANSCKGRGEGEIKCKDDEGKDECWDGKAKLEETSGTWETDLNGDGKIRREECDDKDMSLRVKQGTIGTLVKWNVWWCRIGGVGWTETKKGSKVGWEERTEGVVDFSCKG